MKKRFAQAHARPPPLVCATRLSRGPLYWQLLVVCAVGPHNTTHKVTSLRPAECPSAATYLALGVHNVLDFRNEVFVDVRSAPPEGLTIHVRDRVSHSSLKVTRLASVPQSIGTISWFVIITLFLWTRITLSVCSIFTTTFSLSTMAIIPYFRLSSTAVSRLWSKTRVPQRMAIAKDCSSDVRAICEQGLGCKLSSFLSLICYTIQSICRKTCLIKTRKSG